MNVHLSKSYLIGVFEMLLANLFVGINVVLNKFIVGKVPILVLLEIRYLFGILILFFVTYIVKRNFAFYLTKERFSKKDWIVYLLMALSGGVIFNLIYILGLDNTTATSVGIIGSSLPTLIAIFSFFILKYPLKRVHLASIVLVFIGVMFLNINKIHVNGELSLHVLGSSSMVIGNIIVFIAMIPEALFTVFAKMINIKVCPLVSGLLINLFNAIVCLPFFIYYCCNGFNIFTLEANIWVFSFLIGLFSGALFYVFYNKGIAKIDTSTAALLTGVVPISAAIFAILLLNEPFGLNTFLGIFCVLISIIIGVKYSETSKVLFHRVR